ncbi:MAG: DUF1295 domain-containing protein [Bacteroidales bacterium]|nr:DUF1295 domain-containing protein [Bacteroidales bacterium]
MALLHSFEKSGNFLFKHRGIVPVFVFLACSPILLFTTSLDLYLTANDSFVIVWTCIAILVSLLGMAVRAYTIGTTPHGTSGRNTEKQIAKKLNTQGIYSVVRHPLYLGNYLMWLGLLLFMMDLPFLVAVSLVYWLYYERIMYAEERYLEREFGQDYLDWSLKVPAFLPKLSQFQKGDIPFHFRSVLRREYAGLMAITLCFTGVDYLRTFLLYEDMDWCRPSGIICLIVAVIVLILRTLKHHSRLLAPEENRD